jgi:hypothetical protein
MPLRRRSPPRGWASALQRPAAPAQSALATRRARPESRESRQGSRRRDQPQPPAAATRIEAFVISTGIRSYGGYPDIDALFRDQAAEMDKKRREAMLHKIQQLMHERAMFASIVEPAFLTGVGARMGELPTITGHPYLSPYEDLKLKGR